MLLVLSCSSRQLGWNTAGEIHLVSAKEMEGVYLEAMEGWKKRYNRKALINSLYSFESLYYSIKENDANPKYVDRFEITTYLARGYYTLADYHESKLDDKMKAWKKGTEWAERGLALSPGFVKTVEERGSFSPALARLDRRSTGHLYWYLANVGKWALNAGVNSQLKYKDLIKDMAIRLEAIDPDYHHGALYRYWGAYYGTLPDYAGGDLFKSMLFFNRSIKVDPYYLATRVLMAQIYAVKKQDKKLFEQILKSVIESKLSTDYESYPENLMEKEKAKRLMEKMDSFF
ncbi:MAG: TRAP transporter TatT component family protein [Bacteriovoracaceae bacterium]|nr:TRAP transporter TatT component family protein [Bacteriovoracaceae bacterium]